MYNAVACASVFERAKKIFHHTRSIVIKPVTIRNILFDTGSARLKQESLPQLNHMADMMTENIDLKLRIDGHTDTDPVNRKLEVLNNQYCLL